MSEENNNLEISERAEALLQKGRSMTQEEIFELKGFSSNKLYAERIATLMYEIGNKTPEKEDKDQPKKADEQGKTTDKGVEKFSISTDGKGGFKTDVEFDKLSPRQQEWCRTMARLAAANGLSGEVVYGTKKGDDLQASQGEKGNVNIAIERVGGKITALEAYTKGEKIPLSLQDMGDYLRLSKKLDEKRDLAGELRASYRQIARGFSEFCRDIKDMSKTFSEMKNDMKAFRKLIAQGRTKDAVGKAAHKISVNLQAMIGLRVGNEDEHSVLSACRVGNKLMRKSLEPYKNTGKALGKLGKRAFNYIKGKVVSR